MEDILDLYAREYDMLEPVICLDEKSLQLLKEVKEPLPPKPGKPKRYDYNYERNGTANIFMMFEPLAGIRHVKIRKTKTSKDFVEILDLMVNQLQLYKKNSSGHG